jgi:hypothetical protein
MAGVASWRAFSARWRARQGLPLLNAMDVQYLTPADFCNGNGRPLAPAEQRRRFREYVQAAIAQEAALRAQKQGVRRPGLVSGDLAFVRSSLPPVETFRPEFEYGRPDLPPWDEENLSPRRPYSIPVVGHEGAARQAYWLDPAHAPPDDGDW